MGSEEPKGAWMLNLSMEIETRLFLRPFSDMVARLRQDRRLERAWEMLEREYSDSSLTLDAVAFESGASKNHLNVLLRQATSLTFHQLLIRYRLAQALEMVLRGKYNLLEVALENGFGSMNTFERNFRIILGTTPGEFRKQHNNQDFR